MSFEKSDIYQKAVKEYTEKIYWEILKPIHSIIVCNDIVYLFYPQDRVDDIFKLIKKCFSSESNTIELWYEKPTLEKIIFMWVTYKVIHLWYDGEKIPKYFQSKLF